MIKGLFGLALGALVLGSLPGCTVAVSEGGYYGSSRPVYRPYRPVYRPVYTPVYYPVYRPRRY